MPITSRDHESEDDRTGVVAKPSAAYHHGGLRAALIKAAREALETAPPESVTLKALATRLGVSQPAPYRHFASREALLAEVAADGFERFTADLLAAALAGPPEDAFARALIAYIAFGRRNAGVYRLMFASRLAAAAAPDSPLTAAANASFELLFDAVEPLAPPGGAYVAAVGVWAALHGVVMLEAEGLLAGPDHVEPSMEALVDEILARFAPRRHR